MYYHPDGTYVYHNIISPNKIYMHGDNYTVVPVLGLCTVNSICTFTCIVRSVGGSKALPVLYSTVYVEAPAIQHGT